MKSELWVCPFRTCTEEQAQLCRVHLKGCIDAIPDTRLAIAVAALRKIEINDDCYESAPIAKEALLQIEEDETLGGFRGELLLRRCIEICQEEATDDGTAQKIEARIRALKRDVRAVSNVIKRSE